MSLSQPGSCAECRSRGFRKWRVHVTVWLIYCGALISMAGCSQSSRTGSAARDESSKQPTAPEVTRQVAPAASDRAAPVRSTGATGSSSIALQAVEHPATLVDTLADRAAASRDDWNSELHSSLAEAQLKRLAKLVSEQHLDDDSLADVMTTSVRIDPMSRTKFATVFHDGVFHVDRWTIDATSSADEGDSWESVVGFDGFRQLVGSWQQSEPVDAPLRVTFKIFRIEASDQGFTTRAYLEVVKQSEARSFQQNVECLCSWELVEKNAKLSALRVLDAAESRAVSPHGTLLVDCTRAVMEANPAYRQQIVPGIPYWTQRIGRELMGQFGHHGIAIGDVNGDGLDDIYACDTGGLPNRLYLQQPDGTVLDASRESGADWLEDSLGALLVDLDNDGDQDLVVVSDPYLQFAENDGQGHFRLRQSMMLETDGYSLCAADYDQDHDLDVYVCGYNARRQDAVNRGLPFPLPYHDANNGGRNYLLKNEGNFGFVDVTMDVGLDVDNRRFSLAAAWEDYDNDGDLDLYVANDFGRNCLYQNQQGHFVNVAAAAGVEDQASGMSVSWGDYDRDGWMDLYVSNMFSAAGNRVTYQRKFSEGLADDAVAKVQRMARGNTLFRNRGDGTFEDTSEAAGVTQGRWAWGSRFVDLNNDGWQDLVVANGYITNEDTGDL